MADSEGQPPQKKPRPETAALHFVAKKSVAGTAGDPLKLSLPPSATAADLAAKLADRESCGAAQIMVLCRGKPLKPTDALQPLSEKQADADVLVVYLVRKPVTQAAAAATTPSAASSAAAPAAGAPAAAMAPAAAPASSAVGRRVLLLLRHGQCQHEGESDFMKALTTHGHAQADHTARYISELLAAGKLPPKRALLHSSSRRATETAYKLPPRQSGLEVMSAAVLRETDPTENPMRAEEAFQNLFAKPAPGDADTLVVVAHNNIILYWLMRAADIPIEQAAQAWRLFHLRHASITRVDVFSSGMRQVLSVGAASHIPDSVVTWDNIKGEDMSAWTGGKPERHKFSGRMAVLVRSASDDKSLRPDEIKAVADHVEALTDYMISGTAQVTCTGTAQETANAIGSRFGVAPMVLPDSIADQPEAAFLQYMCQQGGGTSMSNAHLAKASAANAQDQFCPAGHTLEWYTTPGGTCDRCSKGCPKGAHVLDCRHCNWYQCRQCSTRKGRDTVIIVAEERTLLYLLLRSLGLQQEEVQAKIDSYIVAPASVTLVNIDSRGQMEVLGVGDTGHLPMASIAKA